MNFHFQCFSFNQLNTAQLYRLLQLRSEVFIVEQNCAYQDLDDKDFCSHHLLMYEATKLIAYARLIPQNISYAEISIGRIVNASSHRNKGIGKMLMNKAIDECYRLFGKQRIKISAQVYAVGFYTQFGFETSGEPYLEDDIPHVKMILK